MPRARIIVRQLYGRQFADRINYHKTGDTPSVRVLILEVLKHVHVRLPAGVRKSARVVFEKLFDNASY